MTARPYIHCMYGRAVIIRYQFIMQNSSIFFIFVIADGSFQSPLRKANFPPRGIPPGWKHCCSAFHASLYAIFQQYFSRISIAYSGEFDYRMI